MIKITAPEPRPVGATRFLDVDFVDGVAEVAELHPIRHEALIQHGYTVGPEVGAVPSPDEPGQTAIVDLNDLTIAQLRELAGDRVEIPSRATKDEIVALVAGLPAEPIPGSIDNGDGSFTHPGTGVEATEVEGETSGDAPSEG